jgi:hypothetical protein
MHINWRATPTDPPTPPDASEARRWNYTRRVRRLMDGDWERDLDERVRAGVGNVRRQGWGLLDLGANPALTTCRELATLYLDAPSVRHDSDPEQVTPPLYQAIDASGLWSMMPRHQALTIGCREYLLRVSADASGRLRYRPVAPDMVVATSPVSEPDQPDRIAELRFLGERWVWEVLDVSDPAAPVYAVIEPGRGGGLDGKDASAEFLGVEGGLAGEAYPFRRADGKPVLPYVVYHAERRGDRLWDTYASRSLVEGSLNLGLLRSDWLHLQRDVSWPQRFGVNARPAGLESVDASGAVVRQEVVVDRASLLILEAINDAMPMQVGTLPAGGDPKASLEAIQAYAAWMAQDAGVSASDLVRAEGPMSGYAISLSEGGKRASQKRFAPHFKHADERLIALSAILLNRATGSALPESGYSVVYSSIPMSPEELRAKREHVLALLAAGLMAPTQAYVELHPGLTPEQARQDLAAIAAERAAMAAPAVESTPLPEDETT